MPHFTAITLDRFIDAGASRSANTMKAPKASPFNPKPWDYPRRKVRPPMNPALYATPKSTPVPDLPSSFPPSPYIINHKGRGPSVVKKDDASASSLKKNTDEAKISSDETGSGSHSVVASKSSVDVWVTASDSVINELENGNVGEKGNDNIGEYSCDMGAPDTQSREADSEDFCDPMEISPDTPDSCNDHIGENSCDMPAPDTPSREADSEDFCDPHESMSNTSNKVREEFCIPGHSSRLATPTPGVEFYDAWEELSSDGTRIQNSVHAALKEELGEIRLTLMMEIEKWKQAEEALENMQRRWQRMREQLSLAGLTLSLENETEDVAEEICQQVDVIRFVSEAIGRGTAKAEAEIEMENRLEVKNFEIARLCDRLHYYEAVNHEMSQRNQQAVDGTRRLSQRRKRRQRWMWGSIAVTMSIGGVVAMACNYLHAGAMQHCCIEE